MGASRIKGITIEIGGDTTKLVSALAKVDNAISKTQRNLRDINKALKLDPSNTALLKDKQVELSKAIEETKSKLDTEKQAYEQLSHADKTPENVEKMRQLKTQIDLDTVALKDLERQAKESSSVLGTQMQIAGEKIKDVGDKIKGVGDKLASVGQTLTTRVTMPIVAGFGAVIKTTADFDAQMSKVQAISGATAKDMEVLETKAREMGETTKFSATESGQAFEYMAMAGWKTDEMLGGIEGIMNLAAASGEELGKTSDIVTDALTALGMSAQESGRFADILAAASSNANTNVSMMGESFKYAAAPAGLLGYSAEDVAVALGLMANSGIKADMAGTSLRNMFNRMAKPTKESAMAMERLGLELYDDTGKMYSLRQIMDQLRQGFVNINMPLEEYNEQLDLLDSQLAAGEITQKSYEKTLEELNLQAFGAEGAEKARAAAMLGGTRAMSGLAAIASASAEDYAQLTEAVDGSSQAFAKLADGSVVPLNEALASGQEIVEQYNGAAEAMAKTMQDNLTGDITILKSQLQELAISLGTLIMPLLRDIVGRIQSLVDWLNSLDDAQKEQIMKIAAIVAAVGPALLIIGKVIGAIGTIISAIGSVVSVIGGLITAISAIAAPVLIVVGVIAALVAAFVYFYNTNEEFRGKVQEIWENIKTAVSSFFETCKAWFDQFVTWISPVVEAVTGAFSAIWELVSTIVGIIVDYIKTKIEENRAFIEAVMSAIKLIFSSAWTVISNGVKFALETIKTIFTTVFNVIQNLAKAFTSILKGDWKSALEFLKTAATTALNGVKQLFTNFKETLKNIFVGIKDSMLTWGKEMIENLIKGIKEKIQGVKDAMNGVGDAIKERIHFTHPDEGPLKDFPKWAPDMMNQFAQGITDNKGVITDAVNQSFDLKPYIMSLDKSARMMASNTSPDVMSTNNDVNVSVVLQGGLDRLFRAMVYESQKNQQITGQSALMGY